MKCKKRNQWSVIKRLVWFQPVFHLLTKRFQIILSFYFCWKCMPNMYSFKQKKKKKDDRKHFSPLCVILQLPFADPRVTILYESVFVTCGQSTSGARIFTHLKINLIKEDLVKLSKLSNLLFQNYTVVPLHLFLSLFLSVLIYVME